MARLILGTAGHIDHGKTALVKALTGVDTDRLQEEKARGITIELGFAELPTSPEVHFGIVDVPGHEGFVRAMVAGATGMDVVVLVVAADEGVMPQTREHLHIVRLLQVPELLVALTKSDLVEEDWLELVEDEVRDLLDGTRYAEAPILPVSAREGSGLDDLRAALDTAGLKARLRPAEDLARLPVDRAFSLPGAGTVVTGTLWSGAFAVGDRVRLLPGDLEGRIRSLQNHGVDEARVEAGDRVAMALTGADVGLDNVRRGLVVVSDDGWEASSMLTVHLSILPDTGWSLTQRQRVRVHLGTGEVLARAVLLDDREALAGGEAGWVQLRLEAPVLARGGDLVVLRSYSPMTTIGGGTVTEVSPPKRRSLGPDTRRALEALKSGAPRERLDAALVLGGNSGVPTVRIPVLTGLTPGEIEAVRGESEGGAERQGRVFGEDAVARACTAIAEAVEGHHRSRPLEGGMPVEAIRALLSRGGGDVLAAVAMDRLVAEGRLQLHGRLARLPDFAPSLDASQATIKQTILELYLEGGLAPPSNDEVASRVGDPSLVGQVVDYLIATGELVSLDGAYRIHASVMEDAVTAVRTALASRTGLGPSEFREVLPVTRKHLLPILLYMDKAGITVRRVDGTRDVPTS